MLHLFNIFHENKDSVLELSRQMSSCKDLVVEPSQLGSLKGLNGIKDTGFIPVRPLAVKVKPSPIVVVLLGFDDQGAKYASLALDPLFLALSRCWVVPLYTRVAAWRPTESRSAHKTCPAR